MARELSTSPQHCSLGNCYSPTHSCPLVKKFIVRTTSNGERPASVSPTTGCREECGEERDREERDGVGAREQWDYCLEPKEAAFAEAIRCIFADYFVRHFAAYDSFIIMPRQSYEQWVNNREQFNNFDKTSFLSEKLLHDRPFFSAFLETSMFSALIDNKIITFWEQEEANPNLELFDRMIVRYKTASGIVVTPTTPLTPGGGATVAVIIINNYVPSFVQVPSKRSGSCFSSFPSSSSSSSSLLLNPQLTSRIA